VDTNDSEVDKIKIKIRKNNYKKSQWSQTGHQQAPKWIWRECK
jgi:hypothetical protein